jgi:hypothetical protein
MARGSDTSWIWAIATSHIRTADDRRAYVEAALAIRVELKTNAITARSRAAILRTGATEEGTFALSVYRSPAVRTCRATRPIDG